MLRRRMMMQSKGFKIPYIKHGLVFCLDGIEKGTTDGSWIDLVGGSSHGNVNFSNNGHATPLNNGFSIDGTQKALICDYSWQELFPNFDIEQYTVEIVFSNWIDASPSTYLFVGGERDPFTTLQIGKTKSFNTYNFLVAVDNQNTYWAGVNSNSGYLSVSNNYTLQNGITSRNLHKIENSRWGKVIGVCYIGIRFNGIVHALRVYDRILSIEEQLKNYQIDKKRFGI